MELRRVQNLITGPLVGATRERQMIGSAGRAKSVFARPTCTAVFYVSAVAKTEVLQNIRNYKIPAVGIGLVVLFLLSARLCGRNYEIRLENWRINQSAQGQKPLGGVVVFKMSNGTFLGGTGTGPDPPMQPPHSLSVIVLGVDPELDRPVNLGETIVLGARQDEKTGVPGLSLFPDVSFFVKLLVPLLSLLFSLTAVTGEKERGTLKLLLTYPVRRSHIFWGKALGAGISLLAPLGFAYLCEILYLRQANGLLKTRSDLLGALLILCVSSLYGLIFIFAGLCISSLTQRTRSSVFAGLLMWVSIVIVIPNAAITIGALIFPAPTYDELNAELDELRNELIEEELSAHPGATNVFDLPDFRRAMARVFASDREVTRQFLEQKRRQAVESSRLAPLSPAVALSFGLSEIAGTGIHLYGSYLDLLGASHRRLLEAMEYRETLPPDVAAQYWSQTLEEVSSRQVRQEPTVVNLRSSSIFILSMVGWLAAFALTAYYRFRRYNVI
jgi:ABC-type transport system involved in multi-copper enzyme maturation permease subunit